MPSPSHERPLVIKQAALSVLAEDLRQNVSRRPADTKVLYFGRVAAALLLAPRVRAVAIFRLSNALFRSGRVTAAKVLQSHIQSSAGADLHPGATIGPGLVLMHSVGIVIGEHVIAGPGLHCYQGVTLGERRSGGGQPTLGHHVTIGAGAAILGGISVGDGAVIGANSVVLDDVRDRSVVSGAPARPHARRDP